jgi:hypothetical protein
MPLGCYNRVSVFKGSAVFVPQCFIKSCTSPPKYTLFADDGEPMLSRLDSCTCRKHLGLAIDRAWEYNKLHKKQNKKRGEK